MRNRRRRTVLIVGAGQAGQMLAGNLRGPDGETLEPVAFVDDDPARLGAIVAGLPVLGATVHIPEIVRRYRIDEILIAIPSATGRDLRRITESCRAALVPFRTTPAVADLAECRVTARQVRDVRIEDLLGREPVELDQALIERNLVDRCVLVTGAGGSIGSELARQVAAAGPRRLVLFERSESDLFDIDAELGRRHPRLDLVAIVGDVLDADDLAEAFATYRPSRVYHAAAYKHVPLMERHLVAAVRHNVIGTANVANAARRAGAEQFVLMSSDKATRPSSFMGATKRAAERVILSLNGGGPRFCAVRFGNVLGSRGSVVPLFSRQIAAGGPVTLTDPDAVRYFMTVQEAVQLVLQASVMSHGGEIFHLDMGERVRVADLADQLIRLSGFEPHVDIPIVVTGLRPGEKLKEELYSEAEGIEPTGHPRIKVLAGQAAPIPPGWLADLDRHATQRDAAALVRQIRDVVPEYTPGPRVLEAALDPTGRQA